MTDFLFALRDALPFVGFALAVVAVVMVLLNWSQKKEPPNPAAEMPNPNQPDEVTPVDAERQAQREHEARVTALHLAVQQVKGGHFSRAETLNVANAFAGFILTGEDKVPLSEGLRHD